MNALLSRRRCFSALNSLASIFVLVCVSPGPHAALAQRLVSASQFEEHGIKTEKPLVSFRSPQNVKLQYTGAAKAKGALQGGEATPTTLASADFNADGAKDVVAGYATKNGGVLTLLLGNPDAYAPTDTAMYERAMRSSIADTFLPKAGVFAVNPSLQIWW